MKCEKCGKEHDGSYGSGRFCNSKCARSFSTNNDSQDELKDAICPKCGKEHKIRKRAAPKLTPCIECGGNDPTIKKERVECCLYCGKKLGKNQYKYCCCKCKVDYQYLIYINKWKLGFVDGTKSHGNNVSGFIRRYLFEKYGNKCSRCGWDKKNPYINKVILEIEHIDGDCTNNKEENLDLICPNCHSLTSTYKALNYGNGNRERLKYCKLIK